MLAESVSSFDKKYILTPEHQREIASQGDKAAHEQGKTHQWTAAEAKEAKKKGGKASGASRR